ncbi:MAG: MarR family winged helix-turn-helix transcriptional regulator [Terriglobales bacterium]
MADTNDSSSSSDHDARDEQDEGGDSDARDEQDAGGDSSARDERDAGGGHAARDEQQRDEQNSERPPVPEYLADTAGFLLNRAAHLVREAMSEALSPVGLTPRELGLLRVLSHEQPLTQQMLGRRHNTDRTTIVQMIDAMEKRDLVIRVQNTQDRRSHLLYLTPRGKKVLARALKIVEKEQKEFLAPLTDQEWQSAKIAMRKLIEYHVARVRKPLP